jgi:hypothetical protein
MSFDTISRMSYENLFNLKKPCADCPFRKEGAIFLSPGRLEGIIEQLVNDDWTTFHCHKTVHNTRTGGDWSEEGEYTCSGQESMCAGAAIYLEKLGCPTVAMRLGHMTGAYNPELLKPAFYDVIDPEVEPDA